MFAWSVWRENWLVHALYRELENEIVRLHEAQDYRVALDVIDKQSARFTAVGHRCKIAFFRACLLAKSGAPDAALDVLDEGLAEGLWWSKAMLADADLDSCRGERLDEIARSAVREREPAVRFVTESNPSVGTLFALHGGGEVVAEHDDPWSPAVAAGWTVHRPVSTQRVGAGLATWTDLDDAVDECRMHLAEIGEIDGIGSFSLGASVALRLISEVVRVPAVMFAPSLRPAVVSQAASNLDGAVIKIVTGEHDQYLGRTNDAVPTLRDAGGDVRVEIVPHLAHDFPRDLDQRLPAVLREIHDVRS